MIIAKAGKVHIFGLEKRNIELLMKGKPLLQDLPESDESFCILYGKDKQDLIRQIQQIGKLPDVPRIQGKSRLNEGES